MGKMDVYIWGDSGEIFTIKAFAEKSLNRELQTTLIQVNDLNELPACEFLIIAVHNRKIEEKTLFHITRKARKILIFSISRLPPVVVNYISIKFRNISIVENPTAESDIEGYITSFTSGKRYFSPEAEQAARDKILTERSLFFSSLFFTDYQLDAYRLLLDGHSVLKIADKYRVSRTAARRWFDRIEKKLELKNDDELLSYLKTVPDTGLLLELCAEERRNYSSSNPLKPIIIAEE